MTVFRLSKWAIKRIDKIRRNFLWKGSEEARGGHCLVNWSRVQRPKQFGGLGVLDLANFNRALYLRWQWLQWKDSTKPWSDLTIQHTPPELELFRTCTTIVLGDGRRVSFWHDRWLQGKSPKEIAPNIYRLAWRKNERVATTLANGHWKRGLRRMNTTEQINEYVELWGLIRDVRLGTQPDDIQWNISPNGIYSSASAYLAQFTGTFADHDWQRL
ncbi:hypothetical protein HU200_017220 [Digitaria exilis]|uniref:Uncharacterized protein n=1 Tax=Digitaria exilis TaxID=1010633 RepID=A0A835F7C0_9POAL|nr:hypothetical protein HU200_017220 [Digitaria exilis]